jgi:hypothetical protein
LDADRTSFERRHHTTWVMRQGLSPLALLASWLCEHPGQLMSASRDLLVGAMVDVAARLPMVAAHEPTRRHRKHFGWLLGWHTRLTGALHRRTDAPVVGGGVQSLRTGAHHVAHAQR